MAKTKKAVTKKKPVKSKPIEICGIVMPISSIDGCSEQHWGNVLEIISESIEQAGFEPNLVSSTDEIGVIPRTIIQNLYDNPIVVCDVSAKNSNVMFELGMRLAFDKPTVIIKDDKTTYSFDTSMIEHLEYPRDLRFNKIIEFKELLTEKIKKTCNIAKADPNYSTFLKHFHQIKASKIESKEVSESEYILEELKNLKTIITNQIKNKELGDVSFSHMKSEFKLEFEFDKSLNINLTNYLMKSRFVKIIKWQSKYLPENKELVTIFIEASRDDLSQFVHWLRKDLKISGTIKSSVSFA